MSAVSPVRPPEAYAAQLRQLLPRGAAWSFAPDGAMAGLLLALGTELSRVDARAGDLLEEADPRTALELLPDWERIAALPDTCTGAPDDTGERQVALHQKLTGLGGHTIAAFTEVAARLGYQIEVEEHRAARAGMRCGEPCNSDEWAFAWTARIQPFDGWFGAADFLAFAKVGDRAGVRLQGFGALDVECVIRRAAPAHTIVLFAYDVEPVPVLWVDFTK